MTKQTDFIFRVFRLNPTNPAETSEATSKHIKEVYLDHGWQIMNSAIAQVSAGEVFLGVSFVKYEDVAVTEKAKRA